MSRIQVAIFGAATSRRSTKQKRVAILALFVGIGLLAFLFSVDAFLYSLVSLILTIVALAFVIAGAFILSKTPWRSPDEGSGRITIRLQYLIVCLLWLVFLGLYVASSYFAELRAEGRTARAESADASCAPGVLLDLAQQTPALGATLQGAGRPGACTAQWMRVVSGSNSRRCLLLDDGKKREWYCLINGGGKKGILPFGSFGIHDGGLIVARTAYGHSSAFVYPHSFPRSKIAKTEEDPEEKFLWDLEGSYMLLMLYLFLGSPFFQLIVSRTYRQQELMRGPAID